VRYWSITIVASANRSVKPKLFRAGRLQQLAALHVVAVQDVIASFEYAVSLFHNASIVEQNRLRGLACSRLDKPNFAADKYFVFLRANC
jgi:hypothetical protein